MTTPAEWAKKNSPFLKLADGETFKGAYSGWKEVPDSRDPTKNKLRYTIGGKYLDSASGKLAVAMSDVPVGSIITITRQGTGQETKYEVKVISGPSDSDGE